MIPTYVVLRHDFLSSAKRHGNVCELKTESEVAKFIEGMNNAGSVLLSVCEYGKAMFLVVEANDKFRMLIVMDGDQYSDYCQGKHYVNYVKLSFYEVEEYQREKARKDLK